MKRIIIDAEECVGCRLCEMVCSFHHEGRFSPSLSRVTVIKEDKHGLDYPVLCHQCDPCPSVGACPEGALTRTKSGVIHLDSYACVGCGNCVDTCAFNAIKLGESGKPIICDLCDGNPLCVERCPTNALIFKEYEAGFEHPEKIFEVILRRWEIDA